MATQYDTAINAFLNRKRKQAEKYITLIRKEPADNTKKHQAWEKEVWELANQIGMFDAMMLTMYAV